MLQADIVDGGAVKHAGQFGAPFFFGQPDAARKIPFSRLFFVEQDVVIGHGGDLRAVRDTDHLVMPRQQGQFFRHSLYCSPADTGIHLVKD